MKEGFSDWRNTIAIDNHDNSAAHQDSLLTYLTHRQGVGMKSVREANSGRM